VKSAKVARALPRVDMECGWRRRAAFFLGAVATFVSLMMSRLAALSERIKATRALPDQDGAAVGSSVALGTLTRRARLLSDGIILSLGSGMCAALAMGTSAAPDKLPQVMRRCGSTNGSTRIACE
jgi:hypothetical protein